jgi:hypothetical protein
VHEAGLLCGSRKFRYGRERAAPNEPVIPNQPFSECNLPAIRVCGCANLLLTVSRVHTSAVDQEMEVRQTMQSR